MADHMTTKQTARVAPWAYAWWVVVGGLAGLGVIGLLTIGIIVLVVSGVLLFIGMRVPALANRSMDGLVGGLAAAPLYLAWINRKGPGDVCETIANGISCVEQSSPWLFLAVGVALLVGCVVLVRSRSVASAEPTKE